MPRENAAMKGRRLLSEGRLTLRRVDPDTGLIVAVCKGDSGPIYELGFDHGEPHCDCAAIGRCSHLVALALVTTPDERSPS